MRQSRPVLDLSALKDVLYYLMETVWPHQLDVQLSWLVMSLVVLWKSGFLDFCRIQK